MSLISAVCCRVEVFASSSSLVQEGPTECGVSNECDRLSSSGKAMSLNRVETPQEGKKVFLERPDPSLKSYTHSPSERPSLRTQLTLIRTDLSKICLCV